MVQRPSERRNQKAATPPAEQNLIPIMNLFLSLIPFLLMMLVITQVAMISLNFSAGGGDGGGGGKSGNGGETKELKVIIYNSEGLKIVPGFDIRDADGTITLIRNDENGGQFNFVALKRKLDEIKSRNADVTEIVLVVYPDVQYRTMLHALDLCKQSGFPSVIYRPASQGYGQ